MAIASMNKELSSVLLIRFEVYVVNKYGVPSLTEGHEKGKGVPPRIREDIPNFTQSVMRKANKTSGRWISAL